MDENSLEGNCRLWGHLQVPRGDWVKEEGHRNVVHGCPGKEVGKKENAELNSLLGNIRDFPLVF